MCTHRRHTANGSLPGHYGDDARPSGECLRTRKCAAVSASLGPSVRRGATPAGSYVCASGGDGARHVASAASYGGWPATAGVPAAVASASARRTFEQQPLSCVFAIVIAAAAAVVHPYGRRRLA